MERHRLARDEQRWLIAGLRADTWNVHIDPKQHRRLTAADFIPGAKTQDDEDMEFLIKVVNGERFDAPAPEEVERYRAEFQSRFQHATSAGTISAEHDWENS